MVRDRVPEQEAVVDAEIIERYIQWSGSLFRFAYRDAVSKAMKSAPMRGKVLDVGTGFAKLATTLAGMNPDVEVVGLDISKTMIEAGRKEVARKCLARRIKFVEADARIMPFPDDSFDAAISFTSLHHWPDPVSIFNEIDRVRKPGGMIFIADVRRDVPRPFVWLLHKIIWLRVGKRLADEMVASVHACYLPSEIEALMKKTTIRNWQPKHTFIDLNIFSPGK